MEMTEKKARILGRAMCRPQFDKVDLLHGIPNGGNLLSELRSHGMIVKNPNTGTLKTGDMLVDTEYSVSDAQWAVTGKGKRHLKVFYQEQRDFTDFLSRCLNSGVVHQPPKN